MTEQPVRNQIVHRWYTRPVLFVADVNRALRFYVDLLGFEKHWQATARAKSAKSIAENARSSSAKTPGAETRRACSSS